MERWGGDYIMDEVTDKIINFGGTIVRVSPTVTMKKHILGKSMKVNLLE
jgi:hypothetical protein